MKHSELVSRTNRKYFAAMNAAQQRRHIGLWFKQMDLETASWVGEWFKEWAGDLLDNNAQFVTCFDVWFVTTVIYDVDIPGDVIECIAEGTNAQAWRNMLNRHGLSWNAATKRELQELGYA